MKSPQCKIASASRQRSMHASGRARFPRGMWVSETMPSRKSFGSPPYLSLRDPREILRSDPGVEDVLDARLPHGVAQADGPPVLDQQHRCRRPGGECARHVPQVVLRDALEVGEIGLLAVEQWHEEGARRIVGGVV